MTLVQGRGGKYGLGALWLTSHLFSLHLCACLKLSLAPLSKHGVPTSLNFAAVMFAPHILAPGTAALNGASLYSPVEVLACLEKRTMERRDVCM